MKWISQTKANIGFGAYETERNVRSRFDGIMFHAALEVDKQFPDKTLCGVKMTYGSYDDYQTGGLPTCKKCRRIMLRIIKEKGLVWNYGPTMR